MPSSGPLPFFQGLICAASNTCYKNVRPSEDAGVVNIYNSSLWVCFTYQGAAYRLHAVQFKDGVWVSGDQVEIQQTEN